MLQNPNDKTQIHQETVRLACAVARARGTFRTPPKVTTRIVDTRTTTGRCTHHARIHLSVPKGASIPQAIALICHEVAHWIAPATAHHGEPWREAFRECLALYDTTLDDLNGTKDEVHIRARQALAARLRLPQASAQDDGPAPPVVGDVESWKKDEVIRKVTKCLALAKNAGSEHEASTAAMTAERLLRAYRISMEDVTEAERDTTDPLVDAYACTGMRQGQHWRINLGFNLAEALGCYALHYSSHLCDEHADVHTGMRFFGRKSSVDVLTYIYGYLLREIEHVAQQATTLYAAERKQIARLGLDPNDPFTAQERRDRFTLKNEGRKHCAFCYGKPHGDPCDWAQDWRLFSPSEISARCTHVDPTRTWGNSFRIGATSSVVQKIRKKREAEELTTGETAMTLFRRDYEAAQEHAYSNVLNIGSASYGSNSLRSTNGHAAGHAAGLGIHITRGVGNNTHIHKQITG